MSDLDQFEGLDPEDDADVTEETSEEPSGGTPSDEDAGREAGKAKDDEPRFVPLATHLEERNKLNARIQALETQNQRYGGLESEIRELRERLKAKEEPPPAPPDYLEDPKGYIDENVKSLAEKVRELESAGKLTKEQIEQRAQLETAQATIKQHVDSFADQTPDFEEALAYAREQRIAELKMLYPNASLPQINSALAVEEFRTGVTLIQQGRNPGEFIYGWAKARGYKPKPVQDEAAEEMRQRRDKAEGLGGGGGAPSGELDNLLADDDDDFERAMKEAFS